MSEYAEHLGDAVRNARKKSKITQNQLADIMDIDVRTIIKIENYQGNPKMEILYPLIRTLHIDAREVFNPEIYKESQTFTQLRLALESCSESEADALLPIVTAVLAALRNSNARSIN